ncbi:TPA_asm: nucleocapsid protein [Aponogeton virus 1]|uniref:Nucleoprotein n=1 Tax=Aponogeton virus 1 TaxID=2977952 RepID=A0A9N6YIV3_9RHAB|nr:TPA_asm: nucleocapsid protein [Aponogeton virus 1]
MAQNSISETRLNAILAAMRGTNEDQEDEQRKDVEPPQANPIFTSPVGDEFEQRMKKFLDQPILPVNEEVYTGTRILGARTSSVDNWIDTQPKHRVVYRLERKEDNELVDIGHEVFTSLCSKITVKAVGNLLLLAYNVKTNAGSQVFGDIPSALYSDDLGEEFDEIPERILKNVIPTSEISTTFSEMSAENIRQLAVSYCYLACSYLRLYTKSAENFSKVDKHLKVRFQNFYDFEFPLENFHPSFDAICSIKAQLELNEKYKNTFYNLLYAGEAESAGKSIKDFLYRIHVSFTGLHPFTLFVRAMDELKLTNRYLAAVLFVKKFESEIRAITTIFDLLADETKPGYELQMWKYARIFDNRFLSSLQTKNCQFFTLVLANLLNEVSPNAHSDVLKIAQISSASETHKRMARVFALRAYKIITSEQMSGNYSAIADMI